MSSGTFKGQRGEIRQLLRLEKIPKNAIFMNSKEIFDYQWKRVVNWKPRKDVWPFTFGIGILGVGAVSSGCLINNFFRNKFKLHRYGQIGSIAFSMGIPCIITMLTHSELITKRILLNDFNCPLCLDVQSGVLQAITGTLYPALISPAFNIVQARKYYTVPLPSLKQPSEILRMLGRTTISLQGLLLFLSVSNFVLGMWISNSEIKAFINFLNTTTKDSKEIIFE